MQNVVFHVNSVMSTAAKLLLPFLL